MGDTTSLAYTFNPLPGVTLTNAFLVSNEVLDRLPVACAFFSLQGVLLWQNQRASSKEASVEQIRSMLASMSDEGVSSAALEDGSLVRFLRVRNLMGQTQGILSVIDDTLGERSGLSALHTGIAIFSRGTFIAANRAACQWAGMNLVGKSWEEVPGLPPWGSVHGRPEGRSLIEVRADDELRIHRLDDTVVVECIPRPMVDGPGLKLSTVAEMVHEIRNPLAAIRGFLELALRGDVQAPDVLQMALGEVRRLDGVAQDMLMASRPLTPKPTWVSVSEALATAWSMISRQVRKDVALNLGADPLSMVYADPDLLHRILINILKNAAEAMGGLGSISVSAAHSTAMTVVEILDSGPGMSPEILASLFGSAKTTKPGGAGLGLIIVRRLMLAHNGQVLIGSGPSGTSIALRFVHPESRA